MFMTNRKVLLLLYNCTAHVPLTELPNHIQLKNTIVHYLPLNEEEVCYTPTEDDIINDITRHNNDGVVDIDDDDNDSHNVPKISTKLPPQHHTTKDLPPHLHSTLMTAFDAVKPAFREILKALKPDLVIYDLFQPWTPQVAFELNIEATMFLTCGAASLCFLLHHSKCPDMEFPFQEISIPETEFSQFNQFINSSVNGMMNKDRCLESQARSSNMVLIKTSREIEAKYVDYLTLLLGKQMVPVGFLVQTENIDHDHDQGRIQGFVSGGAKLKNTSYNPEPENIDHDHAHTEIMDWLSKKEPSSVVYVSFGSEYSLTEEEMEEIEHGIELSRVNFIWVVRFRNRDHKSTIDEALPGGFQERVGERGLIVEGWVPQAEILRHPSIGGFVSHCGWGSTLEAIMSGAPIIAIPMVVDQPFNAKLVVDIGVGVAVPRENGKLKRAEVARVIKQVVLQEEKQMRRKANELSSRMIDKMDEEMDVVVDKLVQLCSGI
ncbi:hypothetical protein Ddye_025331 [Dipteronia dyeriana]|uniref:Glycosyltransferase n=1 Tax=Dipteronia dyeriana TaxID=168575 RepID=A0AAD9TXF9_9ROSI|nr:hypothetical protein Ddye_025331 [Dipteronia dyeriana]